MSNEWSGWEAYHELIRKIKARAEKAQAKVALHSMGGNEHGQAIYGAVVGELEMIIFDEGYHPDIPDWHYFAGLSTDQLRKKAGLE